MSGHSKWSSIKHKKGAADAKLRIVVDEVVIRPRLYAEQQRVNRSQGRTLAGLVWAVQDIQAGLQMEGAVRERTIRDQL